MAHLLSEFEAELGSLAEEVPKPNARVPKTSSKASTSPGKDTVGDEGPGAQARKKVDEVVDKVVDKARDSCSRLLRDSCGQQQTKVEKYEVRYGGGECV